MNMLLTSAGLSNESIRSTLKEMLGKPFSKANLCFIPTAAMAEAGHHDWFVDDLNRVYGLGWQQFDILDLNGLPKDMTISRLENADVIYTEGGNIYALAKAIADNGLAEDLLGCLAARIYVGVSAGSMIFSKDLTMRMVAFYGEDEALYSANNKQQLSPFNLFDWFIKPHVNFKTGDAKDVGFPYYAIDDETAIKVSGSTVEVISEGTWHYIA